MITRTTCGQTVEGAEAKKIIDYRMEISCYAVVVFAYVAVLVVMIKQKRDRFALRIMILNIVYALGRMLDGSFYLHGTFCSSHIYP